MEQAAKTSLRRRRQSDTGILCQGCKTCKIFLGTLAGTDRMRRGKQVDFTPADCRAWTCRRVGCCSFQGEKVGIRRAQTGFKSLPLQEGSAVCPSGYSNGIRKPRSGPVHTRDSAITAEGRKNITLELFQGILSADGFKSVANSRSKRGNSCLPCSEGRSELPHLQGRDQLYV